MGAGTSRPSSVALSFSSSRAKDSAGLPVTGPDCFLSVGLSRRPSGQITKGEVRPRGRGTRGREEGREDGAAPLWQDPLSPGLSGPACFAVPNSPSVGWTERGPGERGPFEWVAPPAVPGSLYPWQGLVPWVKAALQKFGEQDLISDPCETRSLSLSPPGNGRADGSGTQLTN